MERQVIRVPHPLNPNIVYTYETDAIGGGIDSTAIDMLKIKIEKSTENKKQALLLEQLDAVRNLDYPADIIGLYTIILTLEGIEIPLDLAELERLAIKEWPGKWGGALLFPSKEDDIFRELETEILDIQVKTKQGKLLNQLKAAKELSNPAQRMAIYTIVLTLAGVDIPNDPSELESNALKTDLLRDVTPLFEKQPSKKEERVYRLLRPLYNFIGMVAAQLGGSSASYMYQWQKGASLRQRKSPIQAGKDFNQANYFLGDKVLSKLDTEMTPEYFWENVDEEVFEYILTDIALGHITSTWAYLGSQYGTFKIYIFSEATRAKFAEAVALKARQMSGGNAYAKRVDGGGRMNYYLSSGIQTRIEHNHELSLLKRWFTDVYKVGFELRK